ncbi:mannitol-1-phosphate 5-dehydrogenase [Alteribacillus sp. HJP-4]|uniref:mannitol-1-phosphate 5-dehydrogenase n=1 Tax=Alteribacillus sp. HJP-4 TaxID=2775394 RepID=UPI0035CD0DE9
MLALQIGAGNIGRGFVGQILNKAGYRLWFADVNEPLIDELKHHRSYHVRLADENGQSMSVNGVKAIHSILEEEKLLQLIEEADLITTAVGPAVLPHIAPAIAKGLLHRINSGKTKPVHIIACENMVGGTDALKQHVSKHLSSADFISLDEIAGFANAAVDRIVPDQAAGSGLDVTVEPFFEWVVETKNWIGTAPAIKDITFVEELEPFIERKLFTVNTGHAALAYHGFVHGCATTKEAFEHTAVQKKYVQTLQETGLLLQEKYGFSSSEMETYHHKINSRFQNPYLADPVTRVGRGPIRKLGPKDRLVKPSLELLERGRVPEALAETIAALLQFRSASDEEAAELQEYIHKHSAAEAFCKYSSLKEDHELTSLVKKYV